MVMLPRPIGMRGIGTRPTAVAKPTPSWDATVIPAEVAMVAPAAGTLVSSTRVTADRIVRSAFLVETTS